MNVLGGIAEIEGEDFTVSSVLKFDSQAQTWSEVAPMPAVRDAAGACVVDSAIYIFGGRDGVGEATSPTYRYSTETNTWTTLSPRPEAKCAHGVCVLDGLIYVTGGKGSDESIFSSVHRFDPVASVERAGAHVHRTIRARSLCAGRQHLRGGW
jgi:N-acetylneuraminic acid mutarotase